MKPPASRMLDYVELWLMSEVGSHGLTRAAVARALDVNKSTVGRHFDLEATYSRDGGPDAYVAKMAAILSREPVDVWEGAAAMWRSDPQGKIPARHRRLVASRRQQRAREA